MSRPCGGDGQEEGRTPTSEPEPPSGATRFVLVLTGGQPLVRCSRATTPSQMWTRSIGHVDAWPTNDEMSLTECVTASGDAGLDTGRSAPKAVGQGGSHGGTQSGRDH